MCSVQPTIASDPFGSIFRILPLYLYIALRTRGPAVEQSRRSPTSPVPVDPYRR